MEAAILKKMGLNLKDTEAKAILTKYRQERQSTNDSSFNQEKFLLDLNRGLDLMKTSRKANEDDLHRPDLLDDVIGPKDNLDSNRRAKEGTPNVSSIKGNVHNSYFMKIMLFIKKAILARSVSMRGENVFRNSFRLLSECRSPLLTRSQLKGACQYRLNVALTDKQIDLVFNELDPMNLGTLKTRQLISVMFPNQDDGSGQFGMSLQIPVEIRKKVENQMQSWVKNQDAHVTYDHKFSGLTAPDKGSAIHLASIQELEAKILDKIFERSHLGANMIQSLIRYFSDARDKSDKSGISRDQMRYTLWKTFQLNVSDSDIEKLFKKYDVMRSGKIPMDTFIDAIIKGHALNEPLLEDPSKATDSKLLRTGVVTGDQSSTIKSKDLKEFLQFIRQKFHDLINQDGRAPHYLLQCSSRMTDDQAVTFLKTKLNVDVNKEFMKELSILYNCKGLFDMKLLIRDAMAEECRGMLGKDQNLLNGCTVTVDAMPASLRGIKYTPKDIENILRQKINERLKNDHPLSNLHKIFHINSELKDKSNPDHRLINRIGLRSVLTKFDILPNDEDFNVFFNKHLTRGDNLIEIRKFLTHLMPSDNHNLNPFSPKELEDFNIQCNLAKVLSSMSGHRRRQISGLNGPAHTRFGGEEEDEAVSGVTMHAKPVFENPVHSGYDTEYSDPGHNPEYSDPGYSTEYTDLDFNTTHNFEEKNQQFTENFENMSINSEQSNRFSKPTKSSSQRPPNNIFNESYNEPTPVTVESFIKPLRPSSAPPSSINHISPRRNKEKETRFNFTPETPERDQRDPSKASQSPKELASLNKYNQLGQQFIDEKAQQTLKDKLEFQKQSTANPYQYEKIINENPEYDEISESGYSLPSSVRSFDSSTYTMPSYPQRTNPNPKSPGFKGAFSTIRPASVGGMTSARNTDTGGGLNTSRNVSHVKAWKALDSSNQVLQQRYKIASKNTTTNQEEYGLFIKNVKKAKKQQHRLRTKLINKNDF